MKKTTKINQSITNRDQRERELADQIKTGSLKAQNELIEANLQL